MAEVGGFEFGCIVDKASALTNLTKLIYAAEVVLIV